MKEIIEYYYNIRILNIVCRDEKYYIDTVNEKYIFRTVSDIENANWDLIEWLAGKSKFAKIINTNENRRFVNIDNKKYVLMKTCVLNNYKISIYDIGKDSIADLLYKNVECNWPALWENKIDVFENMFLFNKEKYIDYVPMFEYYIGLGENAIQYLKQILQNSVEYGYQLAISHYRVVRDTTLYDYYDPLNVIIDHISRDISEYIKSEIICDDFDIDVLDNYLSKINLTNLEVKLLFSRLLFPTFFFDWIEKNGNLDFLKYAIERIEINLKQINELLNKKFGIELVKWLSNKKI